MCKELDLLSTAKWRLIEDMIPIYKYIGLGLLKLKGDLGLTGNGYELPAFSQATNPKVFRCHKSEALKDSWEQHILKGLPWIQDPGLESHRPLQSSGIFLIKWHGTQGKMDQININQPKTILGFRAVALLALHRPCREAECKSPGFYCRICHLGGFCSSLAAPGHVLSPRHTPCAVPSRLLPLGRRVRLLHW